MQISLPPLNTFVSPFERRFLYRLLSISPSFELTLSLSTPLRVLVSETTKASPIKPSPDNRQLISRRILPATFKSPFFRALSLLRPAMRTALYKRNLELCIRETLNVLNSCIKENIMKRIILTLSCSAIRYCEDAQDVSPLKETHWSDPDYHKRNNLWYAYAKTFAEKVV